MTKIDLAVRTSLIYAGLTHPSSWQDNYAGVLYPVINKLDQLAQFFENVAKRSKSNGNR